METLERLVMAGVKGQKDFEAAVKIIDQQSKALDYARTSLGVLNGPTDKVLEWRQLEP